MKLSIDTKAGKVFLDGKPLETITELSFVWIAGNPPKVTITADLDVNMNSEIFGEIYNEVRCPKCGYHIGKINAAGRMYGLKCPHCGGDIDKIAPCGITTS